MLITEKYIITGGPGAGKTSLLQALKTAGYHCSEEASRQVIAEEVANNPGCQPWAHLSGFADKVLQRMTALYTQSAANTGITFFDRGIPDIMAYLQAAGFPIDKRYYNAFEQHPYEGLVFILPPWKEIYINDAERWQTFEEAALLYESIRHMYQALGFTLIIVPQAGVEKRMHFILQAIAQQKTMQKKGSGSAN